MIKSREYLFITGYSPQLYGDSKPSRRCWRLQNPWGILFGTPGQNRSWNWQNWETSHWKYFVFTIVERPFYLTHFVFITETFQLKLFCAYNSWETCPFKTFCFNNSWDTSPLKIFCINSSYIRIVSIIYCVLIVERIPIENILYLW